MATIATQQPEAGRGPATPIGETLDATVPRLCTALRGASSGTLTIPGMRWRVGELGAELAVAEVAVSDARARLTGLEESVVLLNASIAREEREMMAREMNAETLRHDIERAERHTRVVTDDLDRLQQERRELEESRAKTLAEAETAEAMRRATQERIEQTLGVL